MKVQTSGFGREMTVRFALADLSPGDQRELFINAGRQLGIFDGISKEALAEIDAILKSHEEVSV